MFLIIIFIILGVYYLCAMMLVSVSLAVSAIVANMWNRSKRRSYGVPSCVRVVSYLTADTNSEYRRTIFAG